jgi:hypothetical protein
MSAARLSQLPKRILAWWAADHPRTQGRITSSHQELGRALQGIRGLSAIACAPWKCGAGWFSAARLAGKRNACGSLSRVRNGLPTSQEVVIKKNSPGKQRVI